MESISLEQREALLPLQSQIPWEQVMGMRDHIAHGYFDINTDLV